MNIDAKTVMKLRAKTGGGMMDCKKALIEAGGDLEKAVDILRAKGVKQSESRAGRATKEGVIASYIHHNGKLGAMVELLSETDFVAKNPDFIALANQFAMHVAAAYPAPKYLHRSEVPADQVEREKAIHIEQIKDKPAQIQEKILEGKMNSFFKTCVLLEQDYAMDTSKGTVNDVLVQARSKSGFHENVQLRRFARWEVGDDVPVPGADDGQEGED